MAGSRKALIVATYEYADRRLARLRAPEHDAEALSEVLGDPGIGGFDVKTVINAPWHQVARAVATLFKDRRSDDLALLHFSGHGLKDDSGELYFAATDTDLDLLEATAVSSSTVNRLMDRTRAGRVLLFLDCCYAGAFARGMTSRAGGSVDINERLGGRGRAVVTASSALQFAFEANSADGPDGVTGDPDEDSPSVFTSALVRGLRTGEADRDLDGWVGLDELYGYLHDEVTRANPNQTPKKWTFDIEGDLYVARRGAPVTTPAELPREIRASMRSMLTWERQAAVHPLMELLDGDHPGLALAARLALQDLAANDDSSRVRAAASGALATAVTPATEEPKAPDAARETASAAPTAELPVQDRQLATPGPRPASPSGSTPGVEPSVREPGRPTPGLPAAGRAAESPGPPRGPFSLRRPDRPPARRLVVAAALVTALVAAAVAWAAVRSGDDSGGAGHGGPARLARSEVVLTRKLPGAPSALVAVDVDTDTTRVLVGDPKAKLPSVSPDRTMVAYLRADPQAEGVPYLYRDDGSKPRQLLGRDSAADCPTTRRPAWNQAGDRLAVVCTDSDGRSTGLWLADLGDSSASLTKLLEESDALAGAPTWGEDGEVYYTKTTDPAGPAARTELWHVPADGKGGSAPVLSDRDYSYSHPDWSKFALLVLQTLPGRDQGEVAVLKPDGGVDTVAGADALRSPTWGADAPLAAALGPSEEDPDRTALWTFDVSNPAGTLHEVGIDGELGSPAWGSR